MNERAARLAVPGGAEVVSAGGMVGEKADEL
jgi:hypothetical protein